MSHPSIHRTRASRPWTMRTASFLMGAGALLILWTTPALAWQSCDWSQPPSASKQGPVDHTPPDSVTVVPVFFVPSDQVEPSDDTQALLVAHLELAQERYLTLLDDLTTFRLSREVVIHRGMRPLAHYREVGGKGVTEYLGELLNRFGYNRITVPYIFFVIVMNSEDDYPVGSGRPINGGYNTGGGIVAMSSKALEREVGFQSTVRHELGHAFGLPHVDVYGYDMGTNPSLMSYNLRHHTRGFEDGAEPGILIPEDLRGLALNDRALPNLEYDQKDTTMGPPIWLGPFDSIPGQPEGYVSARTPSGELYGTQAKNAVQGMILPSAGPGVTFDALRMWHSAPSDDRVAILEIEFPIPVTLDSIAVHSGHSGLYHPAEEVRIEAGLPKGPVVVADQPLTGHDDGLSFAPTTARRWCLTFRTSESRHLTLRGLEFFGSRIPVFPPWVPYREPMGPKG